MRRTCNVCGIEKDSNELVASKRYKGGFMPCCKPCRNEYWRRRRKLSPEARIQHNLAVRRSRLLSQYQITQDDYEHLLREQNGTCKLCGSIHTGRHSRWNYWNVDHHHKTGKVRGLLCHTCNIAIGQFEKLADRIGRETVLAYIDS